MDAMESIKTEAREAIHDELLPLALIAEGAYPEQAQAEWDNAVERIVARIESAADDMDPDPWRPGNNVEHKVLPETYGVGTIVDRTEADGNLHTVKVRWDRLSGKPVEFYSPAELTPKVW